MRQFTRHIKKGYSGQYSIHGANVSPCKAPRTMSKEVAAIIGCVTHCFPGFVKYHYSCNSLFRETICKTYLLLFPQCVISS